MPALAVLEARAELMSISVMLAAAIWKMARPHCNRMSTAMCGFAAVRLVREAEEAESLGAAAAEAANLARLEASGQEGEGCKRCGCQASLHVYALI